MSWDFSSVGGSNSDKPRVLLVDQEAAYTAMLRQYLERHGFAVEHVTNGREALGRSPQSGRSLWSWTGRYRL
jgi:CheY-like chemotaxis protein